MNEDDNATEEDTECRVEGCDFTGTIREVAEHFREEHEITATPPDEVLLNEYSTNADNESVPEGTEIDGFEEND